MRMRSDICHGTTAIRFDRLLVAQSQIEGMTLVTNDGALRRYEVEVLW